MPAQFSATLVDSILEKSIVLSNAEVFPMQSNTLTAPSFNYSDHANIGGNSFVFEWLAENAPATEKTGQIVELNLRAKKLALYTSASIELVTDGGPTFTRKLEAAMTDSAAFGIDFTLLNSGNGTGQPLSVLKSPNLIVVPKENLQPADTITFPNLLAMMARVDPASYVKGSWYAHPSTLPALFQMVQLVRNEADSETVGGIAPAAFTQTSADTFSLLGRPLRVTEKMNPVGDEGDIAFLDLSRYVVGMRKQMAIETSTHAGWSNYSQKFRLVMRLDGSAKDASVISPITGPTMSPFVVLAARA